MTRLRLVALTLVVFLMLPAVPAWAAPGLALSRAAGPPTATVKVTGGGFPTWTSIDVKFDGVVLAETVSDGTGAFAETVTIPRSSLPGTRTIRAATPSGTAAGASFTVRTDWTQFDFNARGRGVNPYENVITTTNADELDHAWVRSVTGPVRATPVVARNRVYVGTTDGWFYALDAATGAQKFAALLSGPIEDSAALVGNVVVVPTTTGDLYGLNPGTGAQKWVRNIRGGFTSAPTIVSGMVYVSAGAGMVAVNAADGTVVWSTPLDGAATGASHLAGTLFVGTEAGTVYKIRAADGAVIGNRTFPGGPIRSTPTVAYGWIYYITTEQVCRYAVDFGQANCLMLNGNLNDDSVTVVDGSRILVPTYDQVRAYNRDLTQQWVQTGIAASSATLAAGNGVIYQRTGQYLYARRVSDGAQLHAVRVSWRTSSLLSGAVVADGRVFTGTEDSTVVALDTVSAAAP